MRILLPWVLAAAAASSVAAQTAGPTLTTMPFQESAQVRADLLADRTVIQAGQPVWVTFLLTNLTSEPIALKVPDAAATEAATGEMGLPLSHVFSGVQYKALTIKDNRNEQWDAQVTMPPTGPVPLIRLAPHGSVGLRVDLTQQYLSMKRPGKYALIWRPYHARIESAPLNLTILAERQAVVLTELGKMTIRFYYQEAPVTIQNFTDLAEQRFYDRLTFHKIIPRVLIQGGAAGGSNTACRPDGKRVKAEFSKIPFERGTVGMARLPSDPDSASSQFFITVSRQPSLDGNYTAFGYLVGDESFQTLDKIASLPIDERYRPRLPVAIRAITLENVPIQEPGIGGLDVRPPPVTSRPAIMEGGTQGTPGPAAPAPATPAAPAAGG